MIRFMLSLIENMFDDTEFDLLQNTEIVGSVKFKNGKYLLSVQMKGSKYSSRSTHKTLEAAFNTAVELLEK